MRELREIRLRRGLSQADLSAKTGVAEFTISEIETGKRTNPRPSTLRKLAEALGVEVANLYGEPEHPLGEAPPSPEQPSFNGLLEEERRARLDEWLKEQGARRAILSDEEVLQNFERLAASSDREAITEQFDQETRYTLQEEAEADRALAAEFARGSELLPKVESGPDLVKRAFARHKEYGRLKREVRGRYSRYYRALEAYSKWLYLDEGRTDDYLILNKRPQIVEAEKAATRALREAAFENEQGA